MSTLAFQTVRGNNIQIPLESGDAGFRTVGDNIFTGQLELGPPDEAAVSEWTERAVYHGLSDPGDILSIATLNSRGYARFNAEPDSLHVPEYASVLAQLMPWCATLSLKRAMLGADSTLIGCVGARFHHDAAYYEHNVFCIVWLSDAAGLDLVFPHQKKRVPLSRGTVALFDSGQVHGVIPREASTWSKDDLHHLDFQFLLSFNIDIGAPQVAQSLGIEMRAEDQQPNWGSRPRLPGNLKGTVNDATGAWTC